MFESCLRNQKSPEIIRFQDFFLTFQHHFKGAK